MDRREGLGTYGCLLLLVVGFMALAYILYNNGGLQLVEESHSLQENFEHAERMREIQGVQRR